jgi:uncharacterized MAPEG superfamily protein
MSIAIYCLIIAGLLPYIAVGFAKAGGGYDNRDPRTSMAQLTGRRARAYAAHQNSFEAFPLFAAAVLSALWGEAQPTAVSTLSIVFILARLAYLWAYLQDRPTIRSIVWSLGFFACLGLFILAI